MFQLCDIDPFVCRLSLSLSLSVFLFRNAHNSMHVHNQIVNNEMSANFVLVRECVRFKFY